MHTDSLLACSPDPILWQYTGLYFDSLMPAESYGPSPSIGQGVDVVVVEVDEQTARIAVDICPVTKDLVAIEFQDVPMFDTGQIKLEFDDIDAPRDSFGELTLMGDLEYTFSC